MRLEIRRPEELEVQVEIRQLEELKVFNALRLSIEVLMEVLLEILADIAVDIAAEVLKEFKVLLVAIYCWDSFKS